MSRQTKSFLIARFREMGIAPATRHGQNFLIDLNLVDLLVNSADLGPQDVVLEVGTGTGSLTAMMAERGGRRGHGRDRRPPVRARQRAAARLRRT